MLRKHLPFLIFFAIFLVAGVSIYKDYGVSWDEADCRLDNGILNTNFIKTGNSVKLLNSPSKYHGPAFEMFLVVIEKTFGLNDQHDIFQMRHLVTFFLFALSVFFFYLICLRNFNSKWLAFAGCAFLVLSPRIFADSFYNNKDLVFLSMIIISIYTSLSFFEKQNFKTAIYHALVSGLLIDIRVMGIIIPMFTLLIVAINFLRNPVKRNVIIKTSFMFAGVLIATIILFWPVLWLGPIEHFSLALKEMSKYPWIGKVLYRGQEINVLNLPWHYVPVWILISTPVLYTIFFFTGLFVITGKLIQRFRLEVYEWLNLYIFFVPLLAVIFMHSVLYDGWRHLYFIYPSFIIIALTGIKKILSSYLTAEKQKTIFKGSILIYCAYIATVMSYLHPFENIYFNRLAGKSLADIRNKYEMDYWALSYKQGYEYILKNDTSSEIFVMPADPQPGADNMLYLPDEDRERITLTNSREVADYTLTCYRYIHALSPVPAEYDVKRDDGIIHSVFALKDKKFSLTGDKNRVASYMNDYENIPSNFHPDSVITDQSAYSGNHVEKITSGRLYGGGFLFNPPIELTLNNPGKKYLSASMYIKSDMFCNVNMAMQIDSFNVKTYSWVIQNFQKAVTNKWSKIHFVVRLPDIYSVNDVVKIFMWNTNSNEFCIDDFRVDFYKQD